MDCDKELSELPPAKRRFRCKLRTWLRRFMPAELLGTLVALLGAYLTYHLTGNKILAAYAGTFGETVGFYFPIVIYDSNILKKKLKINHKQLTIGAFAQLLKRMAFEFGPAELLDSLLLRPFLLYIFPILIGDYPLGILAGKITGDILFYIPVLISQRLHSKYGK